MVEIPLDYHDILDKKAFVHLATKMKDGSPQVSPVWAERAIMIRGRVTKVTEEGAEEHIDSLAKKYLDKDKYPYRQSGEVRVKYFIEPLKVATMG